MINDVRFETYNETGVANVPGMNHYFSILGRVNDVTTDMTMTPTAGSGKAKTPQYL